MAVNDWNEEAQLKWLKVRFTGRTQSAFQHLANETQDSLELTLAVLKERFEPSSQKTRYQAELQTHRKKKVESWADLAEDLHLYSYKAYPELDNNAREIFALNAYLGLLDNPQVAFGVKQRTPANLDAAIAATLELESYLSHEAVVSSVKEEESTDSGQIGAVSVSYSKLVTLVEKLINRVEKLEVGRSDSIGKQLTRRGCQENGGAWQGWRENELEYSYLQRDHMLELW